MECGWCGNVPGSMSRKGGTRSLQGGVLAIHNWISTRGIGHARELLCKRVCRSAHFGATKTMLCQGSRDVAVRAVVSTIANVVVAVVSNVVAAIVARSATATGPWPECVIFDKLCANHLSNICWKHGQLFWSENTVAEILSLVWAWL